MELMKLIAYIIVGIIVVIVYIKNVQTELK